MGEDLIYVEDVIKLCGGKITKSAVYGLIRERKLKAIKMGKRWVFSKQGVTEWLSRNLGRNLGA